MPWRSRALPVPVRSARRRALARAGGLVLLAALGAPARGAAAAFLLAPLQPLGGALLDGCAAAWPRRCACERSRLRALLGREQLSGSASASARSLLGRGLRGGLGCGRLGLGRLLRSLGSGVSSTSLVLLFVSHCRLLSELGLHVEATLARNREPACQVLLGVLQPRGVLELPGRVLEAQVEELLARPVDELDQLRVVQIVHLDGLHCCPAPSRITNLVLIGQLVAGQAHGLARQLLGHAGELEHHAARA